MAAEAVQPGLGGGGFAGDAAGAGWPEAGGGGACAAAP